MIILGWIAFGIGFALMVMSLPVLVATKSERLDIFEQRQCKVFGSGMQLVGGIIATIGFLLILYKTLTNAASQFTALF